MMPRAVLDEARQVMPQVSAGTKRFRVQNPYGTDSMDLDIYSGLMSLFKIPVLSIRYWN